MVGETVDFIFEAREGATQRRASGCVGKSERQPWPEQASPSSGEEDGNAQSQGCEAVAVAVRAAFDDPVEAKAMQVVGHPGAGDGGRVDAQQLR